MSADSETIDKMWHFIRRYMYSIFNSIGVNILWDKKSISL